MRKGSPRRKPARSSLRAKRAEWKRLRRSPRLLHDTVAKRLFNNILVAAERGRFSTQTDVAVDEEGKLTISDLRLVQRLTHTLLEELVTTGLYLECGISDRGLSKKNSKLVAITIRVDVSRNGAHYLRSANLSVVRKLYRALAGATA